MNWNLAFGGNRQALLRILASLFAMIGMSQGACRPATLPRHLHRLVLRLLRPAESATRRLIILAARAIAAEDGFSLQNMPRPRRDLPRATNSGMPVRITPRGLSLPLLDPLIRIGDRRTHVKPSVTPGATLFGLKIPFFQPRAPEPRSLTQDDPLDAGRLTRRLEAVSRALDDLHGMARRLALWQARRDSDVEVRERGFAQAALSASSSAPSSNSRESAAADAWGAALANCGAGHQATDSPAYRAESKNGQDAHPAPAKPWAALSDPAQRGARLRDSRSRARREFRFDLLRATHLFRAPATFAGFVMRPRTRIDTS